MSEQKKSGMGNVSRAAQSIKDKLEVSFFSDHVVSKDEHPEVSNLVNTEIGISGKSDFESTSRNQDVRTSKHGTENRYKKVVPRAKGEAKAKATFCLDSIAVEQLNAVYIKRLGANQKFDRSSLIYEAISLLFEKENRS